jgi:hypothetical protein
MSQIQALLNVDAGRMPAGAVVFFPRDPEAVQRRVCGTLAAIVLGGAVALFVNHAGGVLIPLLALIGVGLTVGALPTLPDFATARPKRPTLLVTQEGIIVRDEEGLRSWDFDDLATVRPYIHRQTLGILIVRKSGDRDFLDTTFFERGEKVREMIGRRLKLTEA